METATLKLTVEGDPQAAAVLLGALESSGEVTATRVPDSPEDRAPAKWYVTATVPVQSPVVGRSHAPGMQG